MMRLKLGGSKVTELRRMEEKYSFWGEQVTEPVEESEEAEYKGRKDSYTAYYGETWEKQRQRALKRDNFECTECGLTQEEHRERDDLFGNGLHVHHIEPAKEFETYEEANKLSNLKTLCANCHREHENNNQ